MMKFLPLLLVLSGLNSFAQNSLQEIKAESIFTDRKDLLKKEQLEKKLALIFEQPISKENQHEFASACETITQFQLTGSKILSGLDKMFLKYFILSEDSKSSLLETTYSLFPKEYKNTISSILNFERNHKLFSICALYMYRLEPSEKKSAEINKLIEKRFPDYDSISMLTELISFLEYNDLFKNDSLPPLKDLIQYQQVLNTKVVYSFQRWNRDYAGLAIIQNEDGSFARDSSGQLVTIQQLARSGSNLPYFITNGNTPQGVFSIQGTSSSKLPFIGPTPNLQLLMPFEDSASKYFHTGFDSTQPMLENYRRLFPPSWRNQDQMMEVFMAGKLGRTEIISHGTTLPPSSFIGKNYYPISPSQGCLTAKETWDEKTGQLISSDQWKLFKAFSSTPGEKGYLIVINLDNKKAPVTRQEIEKLVAGSL